MATDPEEVSPEIEEEGGPVKSFLEHLEDLRWTLMKCVGVLFIFVLVCMFETPYLVKVIKWPLDRAQIGEFKGQQKVALRLGTNFLGSFLLGTNQFGSLNIGTNHHVTLDLVTVEVASNQLLTVRILTNEHDFPESAGVQLLNLSPAGGFVVAFQMAIYAGIVLASPWLIYFIAQFVLPAMKINERKYILRGFGFGVGLFLTGVCFCYFVLMPVALKAAVQYSTWMGFGAFQWTAELYISFVTKFLLGMGLGFELPVVLLFFVKIGLLDYQKLASFRRYMIVLNLILGAVLTTPEIITQILMAIPLQILYEVTVWIAWYWERQEKKRRAAEDAAGPTPEPKD